MLGGGGDAVVLISQGTWRPEVGKGDQDPEGPKRQGEKGAAGKVQGTMGAGGGVL